MAREAARVVIKGHVQGVGYRWWAQTQARGLGLAGWVRNLSDGSVEVLAIGDNPAITGFIGACSGGPPAARVQSVSVEVAEDDGSIDFTLRETG